jgi:hypothetical protein
MLPRRARRPATLAVLAGAFAAAVGAAPKPMPPFPSSDPRDWIGPPQTWEGLRGRVVLLDVWAFG